MGTLLSLQFFCNSKTILKNKGYFNFFTKTIAEHSSKCQQPCPTHHPLQNVPLKVKDSWEGFREMINARATFHFIISRIKMILKFLAAN